MTNRFYIATPIFYPNSNLHLGHAYTMIIADIIVRYKKNLNYKVYFQTGSDDYGEKIEKKAASLNLTPQQLVDKNILSFQQLWKKLNVSRHTFYRTSSLQHKKKVQKIFKDLLNKDEIYSSNYWGKYCISCEDYVSNNRAEKNRFCPALNCHSELQEISEPAFFFRISKYYSQLIKHYKKKIDFLLPSRAKKELFSNFLNEEVPDLCITRKDIKWGIPVPNQKEMVIYVWFEALLNYINSKTGEEFFCTKGGENNDEIVHVIGKEITRFHAIYWLIILLSLKKRLPNKILVHGWILTGGEKMSKSKGNVVDPLKLLEKYPSDLLRAYFVAKINFLHDGVCDESLLKDFYHSFLVNDLGNLVARVKKMIQLYNQGIIPKFIESTNNEELNEYYKFCSSSYNKFNSFMNDYELTKGFQQIQGLIKKSNKLIDNLTPWKLWKENENLVLQQILSYLANGVKIIAFLLDCFLPETSTKICQSLNIKKNKSTWKKILDFSQLNNRKISPDTNILFQRKNHL